MIFHSHVSLSRATEDECLFCTKARLMRVNSHQEAVWSRGPRADLCHLWPFYWFSCKPFSL